MHQEMRAARASIEVPDPRTGRGGWGSSSHGDSVAVGGWGNTGEQRVSGGWGASSPNIWNTTASGDGWGETVSGQRHIDSWGRGASGNVGGWGSNTAPVDNSGNGWGTLASGVGRPQDVPVNNAHREAAEDGSHMTETAVVRAGAQNRVEMYRSMYADSDASSECYDSTERRWRKHGDEPGSSASSDSDEGSDDVSASVGCAENNIRPRGLEVESESRWQFNMVVLDKGMSKWEEASYTSAAAESRSSTTTAGVAPKVESRATVVQSSQECVGADLSERSEKQKSDKTVSSASKDDNHKLCGEVHQALCDAIAPEKDGGQICEELAEWLRMPLSLASTGRGEALGDFCVEMSKVIEEHLYGRSWVDGYFMYEAPRLSVTSEDFKANIGEIISALKQVRDEARETCHSPIGDPGHEISRWCPASPYYAPNDDPTPSASAEVSTPEVRWTAQGAQSPEIETATDDITPVKVTRVMDTDHDPVKAKQQKKVESSYFESPEPMYWARTYRPNPEAKSDDVQHNERRPIHVYPGGDRLCEQGSFYHFDIPATGENSEARYTGESGPVGTPEDVDARRRQTGHNLRLAATKPDWGDRREGERAWNRGDLTVLCTEGRCQVNMGDIPVLFTAPMYGGIEHSALAPSGLTRGKRDQFLREARQQFQTSDGSADKSPCASCQVHE